MELLTRKKLFLYLFLFVKLLMDPLGIVDINFFIFHWAQLSLLEPYQLFLPGFFRCYKIVSEMELLARKKLLKHLFLFVKLHMDPLVIVDINFFLFLLVYLSW